MQDKYLMDELNQILVIVSIIGISIGSVLGIVKLYFILENRKPKFTYERIKEGNFWKLMILHPDKPIQKISVFCDGDPLPLSDSKPIVFERTMRVGEGQNFDVGEIIDDNSLILIKYDKYQKKNKWKDITPYHRNF